MRDEEEEGETSGRGMRRRRKREGGTSDPWAVINNSKE